MGEWDCWFFVIRYFVEDKMLLFMKYFFELYIINYKFLIGIQNVLFFRRLEFEIKFDIWSKVRYVMMNYKRKN